MDGLEKPDDATELVATKSLTSVELYEPSFYRGKQGRLMCSGCKSEVFGGTCNCKKLNDAL